MLHAFVSDVRLIARSCVAVNLIGNKQEASIHCRRHFKQSKFDRLKFAQNESCFTFKTTCCVRRLEEQDTPGRRQSKTLFTIDKGGSKIGRNSVFDCHLSPVGRQMTIENSVSNDFLSTDLFDCCLPGVRLLRLFF